MAKRKQKDMFSDVLLQIPTDTEGYVLFFMIQPQSFIIAVCEGWQDSDKTEDQTSYIVTGINANTIVNNCVTELWETTHLHFMLHLVNSYHEVKWVDLLFISF